MKSKNLSVTLVALLIFFWGCQSGNDLENTINPELTLEEFDYFEADSPFSKTSYSNHINHDQIASLGRILFYDPRLSQNNSIACANCHQQRKGFSDNKQFSNGLKNYQTKRNSMTLVNNAYQISHFWEGHPGKLDHHILNPISNHIEMGMRSIDDLVEKLSKIEDYRKLFDQVYDSHITEDLLREAISTFVAAIISYNSKFDKGKEVEFTNFTSSELNGMELFFGKAKCSKCHTGDHYSSSWRRSTNIGLDMVYNDKGAGNGQFKVPSLRNIALTSPYMHDGRFESLEEVVEHYTESIQNHPKLDWALRDKIPLTEHEKTQLIQFLHTLTDYQIISDNKFSNPF